MTYRPFSYHLKNVHPGRAAVPSVNDAAYHFRAFSVKQLSPTSDANSTPQQQQQKQQEEKQT